MRLVLMVHSSNSEYNADCDCAVVDVTPALAELIRRRADVARDAARQDGDVDEISFWDGAAEFYSHELIDTCQKTVAEAAGGEAREGESIDSANAWLADLESTGYATVPRGVDPRRFEAQQTEIGRMLVSVPPGGGECEVSWSASPKHTDINVSTWEVPVGRLENLAVVAAPQPLA